MTKAEQMIQEYKLSQQKHIENQQPIQKNYAIYYICGTIAALTVVGLSIFLWRNKGVA